MPVTTINYKDILSPKRDGEFVTAEEWNKLIALFTVLNDNAEELLKTNERVDINSANILNINSSGIADNGVSYAKLSKEGGTTTSYIETSDESVDNSKTYYTYQNGVYTPRPGVVQFEPGVTYFELVQVPSEPAINGGDVIGSGVIVDKHLKRNTLTPDTFIPNILSKLLANCQIDTYTVPVSIPPQTSQTVTFKLNKSYTEGDAVLLLVGGNIVLKKIGEEKVLIYGPEYYDGISYNALLMNALWDMCTMYDVPSKLQNQSIYDGQFIPRYTHLAGAKCGNKIRVSDITLNNAELKYTIYNQEKNEKSSAKQYNFDITVVTL